MVARFVVLAALIVVAEIGGTAAQHFMMGQGTSSCGSWKEAAVSLSGKPDIEPKRSLEHSRDLPIGPLVTDRAMEAWYHPSIA